MTLDKPGCLLLARRLEGGRNPPVWREHVARTTRRLCFAQIKRPTNLNADCLRPFRSILRPAFEILLLAWDRTLPPDLSLLSLAAFPLRPLTSLPDLKPSTLPSTSLPSSNFQLTTCLHRHCDLSTWYRTDWNLDWYPFLSYCPSIYPYLRSSLYLLHPPHESDRQQLSYQLTAHGYRINQLTNILSSLLPALSSRITLSQNKLCSFINQPKWTKVPTAQGALVNLVSLQPAGHNSFITPTAMLRLLLLSSQPALSFNLPQWNQFSHQTAPKRTLLPIAHGSLFNLFPNALCYLLLTGLYSTCSLITQLVIQST